MCPTEEFTQFQEAAVCPRDPSEERELVQLSLHRVVWLEPMSTEWIKPYLPAHRTLVRHQCKFNATTDAPVDTDPQCLWYGLVLQPNVNII